MAKSLCYNSIIEIKESAKMKKLKVTLTFAEELEKQGWAHMELKDED